ncbi:hypothetical protein E2I00_013579, partial [Balaenoptera physalus]
QIGALADQHIVHVACGESHSLALSDRGQLFSWGAGSDGQLGLVTTEDSVAVPRVWMMKELVIIAAPTVSRGKVIFVDGTCVISGNTSYPLLISDGQFFTWGKNSHGQLGLGKEFPSQASPQRVRSLEGIPLAQVTAGGAHSFALSLSGAVFGWGMNNAGQLGLSDEKDRESPCHVKLLRTQKVVYISCGEEHTASGGVFTFGAGSCGQLGHDSVNGEVNPRRVLELMGSEVTQIACGSGQLSARADRFKYHIVKQIFSGGDQTFVLCSKYENSSPAADFRMMNQAHHTSLINDETIAVWRQKLSEHNSANTINGVIQILSSAACWNGSFLEKKIDEHFKTSPKIPGIDLNSTRVLFEKLMNSQHSMILEQILNSFESCLIPQLSSSPPDVEAMRIYLILPEFPLLQDSKYYITLTIPLAMAILRLDTNPSKVLDNWWSQVCPKYFTKLVNLYKGAVVYLLRGRKTFLIPVNLKVTHVEYDIFYIPEISSLVDIQEDYLMWFLHQAGMSTSKGKKSTSEL